jgi:hypothetical protein
MGQNIQAGPYGADQMEIQRRQRLAQLLQQQSMEPIQAPQGGAFAAPISPLQVAAKMYGGYQAGQIGNQADEKQKALAERMQSERQAALAKALSQAGGSPQPDAALGGGPAMPPDPVGAMGTLAQAQDPMTMQMGAPAINMQQQQMRQQQEQQFRAQQAQEAQRARAQESQLARESREAQALESREARAADVATRREDQADRAQQQMGLRREMEAGRRADRTATVSDNKAFREAQVIAKEDEAFRESRSSLDNATNNLDRLKAEAQKIKDHAGIGRITGIVGAFPDIPGSDAANARALLTTLKSQVGFSVLQAMRDASKTGGALGQVSNIENVLLQNNLAALETSQDVGQMKASLDQIIKYTDDAKKRLTQGFRDSFPKRTPQTRATDKPAGALTPQEQQELDALRQRFGR